MSEIKKVAKKKKVSSGSSRTSPKKKVKKITKVVSSSQALWARSTKVSGPISGGMGFVGDFLEPIMDISTPVFYVSSAICALSGVAWFVVQKPKLDVLHVADKISEEEYEQKKNDNWTLAIFAFSFIALILSGSIHLLQDKFSQNNRGVFASVIPAVANYQDRILNLEKEVEQVKARVSKVEKRVNAVEEDVEDLTKKVDQFIKNPKTANDYFINFAFYTKKGEFENAKAMIKKLMTQEDRKFDHTMWSISIMHSTFGDESVPFLRELESDHQNDLYLKLYNCVLANTCSRKQIQETLIREIALDESNIMALILFQQSLLLWGELGYKISLNRKAMGSSSFNTDYSFALYEKFMPIFQKYLTRENIIANTDKSKRQGRILQDITQYQKDFRKYQKNPDLRLKASLERRIRKYSTDELLEFSPRVGHFKYVKYSIDGGEVKEFPIKKNRDGFLEAEPRLFFRDNENNLIGQFNQITFNYMDADGYEFEKTFNYDDFVIINKK